MDIDIRYRPTWDDDIAGYDFVGYHGTRRVGRIIVWPAGGWDVRWQWAASFETVPMQGNHECPRAAMLELERRYSIFFETAQIDIKGEPMSIVEGMKEALDPKRAELAQHILEAMRLAREQNAETAEYLLEMALKEVLPRDPSGGEVLDRLRDPSD